MYGFGSVINLVNELLCGKLNMFITRLKFMAPYFLWGFERVIFLYFRLEFSTYSKFEYRVFESKLQITF